MSEDQIPDDGGVEEVEELSPAILVRVVETNDGYRVAYDLLGGFDPLRAPIVLELAVQVSRLQVGLARV